MEDYFYLLNIPKVKARHHLAPPQRKGSSQTRNPILGQGMTHIWGLGFRVWSPYPTYLPHPQANQVSHPPLITQTS